jgi:outer membrane protein assembly factor BamA
VRLVPGLNPGDPVTVSKRDWRHDFMYLPILHGEDGYGLTYGMTVTKPDVTSPRGRISVPLSWGGTRQVGLTFDRRFREGPFTRVEAGTAIERQENPAFQVGDTRRRVWARAERAMGPIRVGGTTTWQHVSFGDTSEDVPSVAGDVTLDTRVDPILPRNAVLATASIERFAFGAGATSRVHLEARGFIGLIGQTVLALRVVREDANHPLPEYLQSLLGGWSSLRGFEAGAFTGDTMAAGSVELRVPLTSALRVGKIGVSAFVDEGTAYAKGQRLSEAAWHRGTGGSVWIAATILQFGVSVAHAKGGGTRVNVGGGVTF